jgi:cell shape-determining protein MreC
MNSYRRNNSLEPHGSLSVAFVVVVLLALFVFGVDTISSGAVRTYAQQAGGSLSTVAYGAYSRIVGSGVFESKKSLVDENMQLKDALAQHEEEALRFETLSEENEQLRGMLSLATEDGIGVPVLSSFRSSPYGTFRIGGGKAAGITEGNVVRTPGGFALGVVTVVSAHAATVESFFAPGKEIEMQLHGTPFVAQGRGGGNARAEFPRDAAVSNGDVVIAPTFGGYPSGVVGRFDSASSSAYTTLYIRIPTNLDALRFVYVVPL